MSDSAIQLAYWSGNHEWNKISTLQQVSTTKLYSCLSERPGPHTAHYAQWRAGLFISMEVSQTIVLFIRLRSWFCDPEFPFHFWFMESSHAPIIVLLIFLENCGTHLLQKSAKGQGARWLASLRLHFRFRWPDNEHMKLKASCTGLAGNGSETFFGFVSNL